MSRSPVNIRIGGASGFWGDSLMAARQLVTQAELDYLVFDYLAEITLSIMAAARRNNPQTGYAHDFVEPILAPLLKTIKAKGIKVISNAGGLNPVACRKALEQVAQDQGIALKIALVIGDDLITHQQMLDISLGDKAPNQVETMNAYLGAEGIAKALELGADIVITGRIVDSALVLGPLVHEFNWPMDDYQLMAQGSLAGHIIECGAQCTGGNFTDWQQIDAYEDMGYPIVHCAADGSFIVTKPDNTGGLVSRGTVSEQIVYEIGNPGLYKLPNVICDFRQVKVEPCGQNQVRVTGATGVEPSDNYKVSATQHRGFRCIAELVLAGIDAQAKALKVGQAILKRALKLLELSGFPPFDDTRIDLIGGHPAASELLIRLAVKHKKKAALVLFSKEIAQAATSMAPAIYGFWGGRPKVMPIFQLTSFYIEKSKVPVLVDFDNGHYPVFIKHGGDAKHKAASLAEPTEHITDASIGPLVECPLIRLAWARSGDKGDHANIGVIARAPEYLPWIKAALSAEKVADYMASVLDQPQSSVQRWELPGLLALNFLLEHSLGGGGVISLRPDAQGKSYAQQLLTFPVLVPQDLVSDSLER